MNKIRSFTGRCLIAFAAVIFLTAFNIPPASAVALIVKVVQDVTFKKIDEWEKAKAGDVLEAGNEVKTGKKSLAIVKFMDNSVIRVRENSILRISTDKKDKSLTRSAIIDEGKLGFEISKQLENEEFRFITPTAVASIRGTAGFFSVTPEGETMLIVSEGEVDVSATLGVKQSGSVTSGKAVIINTEGVVEIADATEEQLKHSSTINNPDIKNIRVKTNKGEIIIEYVE